MRCSHAARRNNTKAIIRIANLAFAGVVEGGLPPPRGFRLPMLGCSLPCRWVPSTPKPCSLGGWSPHHTSGPRSATRGAVGPLAKLKLRVLPWFAAMPVWASNMRAHGMSAWAISSIIRTVARQSDGRGRVAIERSPRAGC